jgi:hypothetical protein
LQRNYTKQSVDSLQQELFLKLAKGFLQKLVNHNNENKTIFAGCTLCLEIQNWTFGRGHWHPQNTLEIWAGSLKSFVCHPQWPRPYVRYFQFKIHRVQGTVCTNCWHCNFLFIKWLAMVVTRNKWVNWENLKGKIFS